VFKVSPSGTETVLHSFSYRSSLRADGYNPAGALIQDPAGNLYGTTNFGGVAGVGCYTQADYGCGVVFKLSPAGSETVLHSFTGGADGANFGSSFAGLIQDAAGNLYGTTALGGAAAVFAGAGVVFKLSPTGNETVLYTFTAGADGGLPRAGLVRDAAGNLYGTTEVGGSCAEFSYGCGVVFKLTPN
jgi:uncharacterized repeat protein (TIGR03803 family)